jgi:hypothetical protein
MPSNRGILICIVLPPTATAQQTAVAPMTMNPEVEVKVKPLPGLTVDGAPGRGDDISLRSLGNGDMQILCNCEPGPPGFRSAR